MTNPPTIFSYIEGEENRYETEEVQVFDNYDWNMRRHTQMSLMLKHGIFVNGANDFLRPFKKVIEPILHLRYRAEDIELKDVILYVENQPSRALSFLIKKYHDEIYVKEHDLDSFFDEASVENIDLGGVLAQESKEAPEVLPLQFVAFCDQTDIMGGPIGFKYYFSPDKLRSMASVGWGEKSNGATVSIDELITLAEPVKDPPGLLENKKNRTTGKNIEVYIVRGSLPEHYLEDNDNMEKYYNQLHIVAFYTNKHQRKGVILYRKKESESKMKFFTSSPIRGRGLGVGGAEMLFHEQVWSNFLEIHKMKLLEAASKHVLFTDDPAYANRSRIKDMENNEITVVAEGKQIGAVPTVAVASIQLFDQALEDKFSHAQIVGSAGDPVLGIQPPSGTPFRQTERIVHEGKGIHEYRRGKFAKFIEEIYRDWIIPRIAKEILKGHKFLATLSSEEMQWLTEQVAENRANRAQIESVLNGEIPEDKEMLLEKFRMEFGKRGTKQLIEILKDEFKDAEIKISVNVAGKQKNLSELTDKIVNIFRFIFANPQGFQQAMQIPGLAQAFNDILEYSGMSQVDFASMPRLPQPQDEEQMNQQQLVAPAGRQTTNAR